MKTSANASQVFHFVMIKPTHYDADGYPIQWLRSAIPSNSLACLNGLAEDIRDRKALGDGVDLRLHTFDETNRRLKPEHIIRMIEAEGGRGLIAFVGVQSNQFPRTMDLARRFHERDLAVCIGGFHVSGCLSMLPEMPEDLREAQAMGISLFAGEAEEGRLETLLRGHLPGRAQAAVRSSWRLAGAGGRAAADPVPGPRRPDVPFGDQRRSRPRLSVPVLVLHHHQRAGAQKPVPYSRRPGKDYSRQPPAEHYLAVHHR